MEEKKLDINSIIGFILIGAILMYMLWQQSNSPEAIEAREKAKQEQVEAEKKAEQEKVDTKVTVTEDYSAVGAEGKADSTKLAALKNKLGYFAYASTLPSANGGETVLENDVLYLKVNNKGGYLTEVKLKKFVNYDSVPIYMIKDNNALLNINLNTTDSRVLNTKDLPFQPTLTKNGDNQVLSMKLKVSESKYLEYRYELKPNNYMLDFTVRSQGLSDVINSSQEVGLDWELKGMRHAKSITYENRYTRLTYEYDDGRVDKLAQAGEDDETEEDVSWISYRQFFFSSIMVTDKPFKTARLKSLDLVEDSSLDTVYTKAYAAKMPLELQGGEINESLGLYYGPTDSKVLKQYGKNLDESIPFGWGIFGWINKNIFIPLFGFLSSFLAPGIAIIVMTILVRLVLSPVLYKSYLSQAKMKILKPEIAAIQEKHKGNKMKSQQETMALYSKAGASPMSGCLPAFIQLPVFYALFMFFPTAFDLRQKSFLWANDLSSYDSIFEWDTNIPIISSFYGNHVSLFPILAAIAIFFYMKMTTGQQVQSQPTQEGMPDMGKMMKYMIYFSPLLMLVFFNQYASGLSLYYFISNLITIGIMLVIKNYIIDEDKVLAKIETNKKKPKKENRFQKKMAEMMEKAEQQKQAQKKK